MISVQETHLTIRIVVDLAPILPRWETAIGPEHYRGQSPSEIRDLFYRHIQRQLKLQESPRYQVDGENQSISFSELTDLIREQLDLYASDPVLNAIRDRCLSRADEFRDQGRRQAERDFGSGLF